MSWIGQEQKDGVHADMKVSRINKQGPADASETDQRDGTMRPSRVRSRNTASKLLYLPAEFLANLKDRARVRKHQGVKPHSVNGFILEALQRGLDIDDDTAPPVHNAPNRGSRTALSARSQSSADTFTAHTVAADQMQADIDELRNIVTDILARLALSETPPPTGSREGGASDEVLLSDVPAPNVVHQTQTSMKACQAEGRRVRELCFRMLRNEDASYRLPIIRKKLAKETNVSLKTLRQIVERGQVGPEAWFIRTGDGPETRWSHNPQRKLPDDPRDRHASNRPTASTELADDASSPSGERSPGSLSSGS